MIKKTSMKSMALAFGTAFAASLAATGIANAAENPFGITEVNGSFLVADAADGKCGEAKCGASKKAASEAKCGGEKKAASEAKCGGEKKAASEAKCGAEKKAAKEAKCGGSK